MLIGFCECSLPFNCFWIVFKALILICVRSFGTEIRIFFYWNGSLETMVEQLQQAITKEMVNVVPRREEIDVRV